MASSPESGAYVCVGVVLVLPCDRVIPELTIYRSAALISVLRSDTCNFRYHSACCVRKLRWSRGPREIRRISSISLRLAEHSSHAHDNTSLL
jgi:hypothetical protein